MIELTDSAPTDPAFPIIAGPGKQFRLMRGGFALFVIVMGLWFAYDGFINWPDEQRRFNEATPERQALMTKPHNDASILIQRLLAVSLVPLGLFLLPYFFYVSRGQCRLAENTLYLPGHPPIPLDAIQELDKSKWDRKGIARFTYQLPGSGESDTATLDDFAYDQQPIQQIVKQIESHLRAPAPADTASESADAADASDGATG